MGKDTKKRHTCGCPRGSCEERKNPQNYEGNDWAALLLIIIYPKSDLSIENPLQEFGWHKLMLK